MVVGGRRLSLCWPHPCLVGDTEHRSGLYIETDKSTSVMDICMQAED
jgi:hypothetical protein